MENDDKKQTWLKPEWFEVKILEKREVLINRIDILEIKKFGSKG